MSKNNLPWMMWGSWIGAILMPIIITFFATKDINYSLRTFIEVLLNSNPLAIIGFVCLGFLIGWGINSIWRKMR